MSAIRMLIRLNYKAFGVRLAERLSSWKMETANRVQILYEFVCISVRTNAIEEDINLMILSPVIGR